MMRKCEHWPLLLALGEQHVHALNMSPGKSAFEVEIQANELERQSHRLGLFVRMLRGPRIDHVLMNE